MICLVLFLIGKIFTTPFDLNNRLNKDRMAKRLTEFQKVIAERKFCILWDEKVNMTSAKFNLFIFQE